MVWIGLYSSTSFHFLSSVYKSLIERMGAFSVCAGMMHTYVCMSAFTLWFESITVEVFIGTLHIHPWLFIVLHAFFALPSLVLTWAPAHTLVSTCDSAKLFIPQPLSCSVFFITAPQKVPLFCLLKIVHWWTKLTMPPLSSCPLSPISFLCFFFLNVWDTTLCEFRKTQRYPPSPPWFF